MVGARQAHFVVIGKAAASGGADRRGACGAGRIGAALGLQVLHLAPGVGDLQQGLLAWGVDLQVLELQEAVQAAVLRHAAGQGGFAGRGPLVLVDADAAFTGDADALQFAMGAVGVVQCAAVRQGQAGGFAAWDVGQGAADLGSQ